MSPASQNACAPLDGDRNFQIALRAVERGDAEAARKKVARHPYLLTARKADGATLLLAAATAGLWGFALEIAPFGDVLAEGPREKTALERAVMSRQADVVRAFLGLIPRQADGSARPLDNKLLYIAVCFASHPDAIEDAASIHALLAHCDAREQDGSGGTPLMFAAQLGRVHCARALAGASDPFATNEAGHTAFDHAIQADHWLSADVIAAAMTENEVRKLIKRRPADLRLPACEAFFAAQERDALAQALRDASILSPAPGQPAPSRAPAARL